MKLADGFNAADLRNVCTEAGMFAIRAEREYCIEVRHESQEGGRAPGKSSSLYLERVHRESLVLLLRFVPGKPCSSHYRVALLIRNCLLLGRYSRPMPRVLGGS